MTVALETHLSSTRLLLAVFRPCGKSEMEMDKDGYDPFAEREVKHQYS